jgi:hypothetical protein
MIYDIFYVSKGNVNEEEWLEFRLKFPSAQKIENVKNFESIQKKSFTKFFWVVWDDLTLLDTAIFEYRVSKFEEEYVHVFKNICNGVENYFGGVALFPKNCKISSKEFQYKFYINKKEHDIVASKYRYPALKLTTYDAYIKFASTNSQPLFWCVWPDIEITDNNIFDFYFDPNDGKYDYDRSENHVYKNSCNGVESYLSGVVLFSKNKIITEREFNRRFLVDKKEHDLVASKYRYPRYIINTYQEYTDILKTETQKMFWCVWPDIEITDNNIFDFYFDPNDGKYDYDRNENHVYKNSCNGSESFVSGVVLFSTAKSITKREFDSRFLVDKKEHDLVVSQYEKYDVFTFNNYKDYLSAKEKSTTELFWIVPNDVVVNDDFKFDLTFQFNNEYDRSMNHVFLNDKYYDGVILTSKKINISEREIYHRFLIDKKEYNVQASEPKSFDIIFISYNEANADKNYESLISKYPRAKRIHGVKGIQNAHIAAANLAETDMFWVVDADAIIEDTFKFEIDYIPYYDRISRINLNKTVHVWSSKNPINDLVYGYGGVKLLPRRLTANMDIQNPDMTTSISDSFKIMHEISNVTGFNVDPLSTWRSAFRECAKLASRVIDRNYDDENDERLYIWCNVGKDKPYGKYAISGARAGKQYGEENMQDYEALNKINDYAWLEQQFKESNNG